jgi:hypothetical protein
MPGTHTHTVLLRLLIAVLQTPKHGSVSALFLCARTALCFACHSQYQVLLLLFTSALPR